MKEIPFEQQKKIQLDILSELDTLCRKLNLKYSLCGGSLLGAVRHKGFIPWDDDIDIIMPRPDYNKLIDYCKNNKTVFRLICHELEDLYGYLFAKATATNTLITDKNCGNEKLNMGLWVDIFPVDALADTPGDAQKLLSKSRLLREILVARNWKRFFPSKTHGIIYEPIRFAFFILSRFFSAKALIKATEKLYTKEFGSTKYCASVCGSYRNKEILPTSVYLEYTELEFEGKSFMAIKNYDAYLSSLYGEYMTLPPEEKQVSHHSFTACYLPEKENFSK